MRRVGSEAGPGHKTGEFTLDGMPGHCRAPYMQISIHTLIPRSESFFLSFCEVGENLENP